MAGLLIENSLINKKKAAMKNIYILAFVCCLLSSKINAQSLILSTGFDNYAGSAATVPAGWFLSWNTSNSFYTSSGNYGIAAPSYKLGNDSDFVVAPWTAAPKDSISFFVRGNGTPFSPANELQIFQSQDSIMWTQVAVIDSLPTTGTTISVNLNGDPYLRILYIKQPAGGNLAIDDIQIYALSTGVESLNDGIKLNVFPSPSSGLFYVQWNSFENKPSVEIYDMLGNMLSSALIKKEKPGFYKIDLSGYRNGFYFVKIQSGSELVTKRIAIIK